MSRSCPSSAFSCTSVRSLSAWMVSLSLPWDSPPLRTRKKPGDSRSAGSPQAGGVAGEDVLAERLPADAADHVGRAGEAHVDDLGRQADDLEDLRAPVGVDGADAHLRQDLEHARPRPRPGSGPGPRGWSGRRRRRASASAGDGGQGEAGADGVGAVAEQGGEGVDVAGVVGHDHERRCAERRRRSVERLVDGARGQQRRDGARSAPAPSSRTRCRPRPRPRRPPRPTSRSTAARRPAGPSAAGKVASSGMTGHGALSVSSRCRRPTGRGRTSRA